MSNPLFRITIATKARTLVSVDDFTYARNGITFLFGESGIGKSLISKAAYGLLDPDELSITINGRSYQEHVAEPWTKAVRRNSFFVFQEPSSHLNPLTTIGDQIREGTLAACTTEDSILQHLWQGTGGSSAQEILDVFPKPYRPSGGEKQRVLLAMAFKKIDVFMGSQPPEAETLFVFDEPTGSLDNDYRNLFLHMLFSKYRHQPFSILIITHDYSIISEIYRSHRDLANSIAFSELSRKDSAGGVTCHSFSPNEYLNWLEQARSTPHGTQTKNAVLSFGSRFSVFGRNLAIYADAGHAKESGLVINQGEMAYLKAPSGVGKTTLAKIVMGLYRAGDMTMQLSTMKATAKTPVSVWQKKVWGKLAGMVFQHADESLDLQARVREVFHGLPLNRKLTDKFIHGTLSQLFDSEITEEFLNKKIAHLSGGQKQRLNLLRTLALSTPLVVLDEPLNGLDFVTSTRVLELLEKKRQAGAALLMISHNEEIFDALVEESSVYYLDEVQ